MAFFPLSAVLTLTVFSYFANCENGKLLSVVTMFRHGNRGPITMYKNDPYQDRSEELWPEGRQQLTNEGKNRHYELGKWYRQHYKDFIPERYDYKFIRVQSSNIDRCLMSAACNLAGLFPPKGKQVWNKDLKWMPIPIHTTPEPEDALIATGKPCPKFNHLLEEVMKSKEYTKFMKDREPLIRYIQNKSGELDLPVALPPLQYLTIVHDILLVENDTGLALPDWAKEIFAEKMLAFKHLFFKSYVWNVQMRRFNSGPLLDHILTFFEKVLENPSAQKFLMLSAHDSTVFYMIQTLELSNNILPDYAASLTFELRSKNDKPFVNILYKDDSGLQKFSLKNCDHDCSFEKFKNLTSRVRVNLADWEKECQCRPGQCNTAAHAPPEIGRPE